MIDEDMMLLQDVDLLKVVPGSYSETCPISSNDGNEGIEVKVEAVTDIQEEEDLVPVIKAEHEVSCMSMCALLGTIYY
jgi:hypothetical protein